MPKLKTRKASAKRFKTTAGGEVKCHKSHKRHMLTSKTRKRKRQLRKSVLVSGSEKKRILRHIQNG